MNQASTEAKTLQVPSDWTQALKLREFGLSYRALFRAAQTGGILNREERKVGSRKVVFYRSKTLPLFS